MKPIITFIALLLFINLAQSQPQRPDRDARVSELKKILEDYKSI